VKVTPEAKRGTERRGFIRHALAVPVRCLKEGHAHAPEGEARDIGHGGMAFVSEQRFSPGDLVTVQYPSIDRAESLRGEIVWCRPLESPPALFASGLRFLDEAMHFRARLVEQICHIEAYRETQKRTHDRDLSPREAAAEWIARYAARFPR